MEASEGAPQARGKGKRGEANPFLFPARGFVLSLRGDLGYFRVILPFLFTSVVGRHVGRLSGREGQFDFARSSLELVVRTLKDSYHTISLMDPFGPEEAPGWNLSGLSSFRRFDHSQLPYRGGPGKAETSKVMTGFHSLASVKGRRVLSVCLIQGVCKVRQTYLAKLGVH